MSSVAFSDNFPDPKSLMHITTISLTRKISLVKNFTQFPQQASAATEEAWHATLGETPEAKVDKRIKSALNENTPWVLIGGPPCQAYSLAGRSRTGGIDPEDHRVYLYREYLRIIAKHNPPVFVMENVKGILSAKVEGKPIFPQILNDLSRPSQAIKKSSQKQPRRNRSREYNIFSLVKTSDSNQLGEQQFDPKDYLICSENYGIPQARHRVILLGIRKDLNCDSPPVLKTQNTISSQKVLSGLPALRSGLSKQSDSQEAWTNILLESVNQPWFKKLRTKDNSVVMDHIVSTVNRIPESHKGRGGEFLKIKTGCKAHTEWYLDSRIGGVCNHSTRSHITEDLYR